MKLIIAGGRKYSFTSDDIAKLDSILAYNHVTEIVSGGATGADAEGERYAHRRGIKVRRFPANWEKYGNFAGHVRNREMAEYADGVVLFPGGNGTRNMYEQAKLCGLRIFDYRIKT